MNDEGGMAENASRQKHCSVHSFLIIYSSLVVGQCVRCFFGIICSAQLRLHIPGRIWEFIVSFLLYAATFLHSKMYVCYINFYHVLYLGVF